MRNTRALVMIAVALVLALVAVVVAAHWINDQGAAGNKKVAVALVDIPMGARITPEMLNLIEWPSNAMPPGAITDIKQLDNRVSRTAIEHGEPIMESKLAPAGTTGGLSAVVAQGKRAMTVRVNDVVGVAGFALPGNFVDILVNTQEEARGDFGNDRAREQAISKIVLERILVLAVAQESNRDDTKPKVVNAVTLELTPDQVEKLDLARSVGTLSLVLRNQIDPKTADTAGATKDSLLDPDGARAALLGRNRPQPQQSVAKAAAATAAAPTPAPRPVVPHGDKVEVIKGLDRSTQQF
ncbi:Flp pilus assembly protein CpaB [Duganella sp. Leaf61]|uniref:Flp pilus assembly protein CpaB n=1 Tax=Duganella sp. Leaf61 TaxID=1736227 RepID=UPI0006F77B1C|nr:Flp pilus assembly protein CpaB [Duganella sp. Leaf61]KQN75728.1 Flp pilus assembly protein CpaB [Duganella sp. Leaf61]